MARSGVGGADALGVTLKDGGFRRGGRDALGRFRSAWPEIEAANQKNAEYLQSLVLDAFIESLRAVDRPQRETEYLLHALKSRDFIRWNLDGFLVNPKGYLDTTKAAPYWRNLEKGTTRFVGRELQGFFLSREGKARRPSASRYPVDVRMIQTAAVYGQDFKPSPEQMSQGYQPHQTLMQIGGATARRHGEKGGASLTPYGSTSIVGWDRRAKQRNLSKDGKINSKPHWNIVIKRPIKPHDFLQTAIQQGFASDVFQQNWTNALRAAGLKMTVTRA